MGGRKGKERKKREREEGKGIGRQGMHREAEEGNMPALHVLHNLECQHMSYII